MQMSGASSSTVPGLYGSTSPYCIKCGKPFIYVGDVPLEGFPKGMEPWCTCHDESVKFSYKYCPHCGKELI